MDLSIGDRIKKRRKELNITHKQIQAETGISSGNMSGIETGKSLPSAMALIGLSKILNCSTDWILKGESSISENSNLSKIEDELINGFRIISEDDQYELLEILHIKLRKSKGDKEKLPELSKSAITKSNSMVG